MEISEISHNKLNNESELKTIFHFQSLININNIHSRTIYSLLKLHDGRIATGSEDKSIIITSLSIETKQWNQDIKRNNAHDDRIFSFCQMNTHNNNLLISCSGDATIKAWELTNKSLEQRYTLLGHNSIIWNVILIHDTLLFSCSLDHTLKIWENIQLQTSIDFGTSINSIMKLRKKEIIIVCCNSLIIYVYDIISYRTLNHIRGYYAFYSSHMAEISDDIIAISSYTKGFPLVIIDINTCCIIKEIMFKGNICSSLCCLDNRSFLYVDNDVLIQISSEQYEIMLNLEHEIDINGYSGIIIKDGQYLITTNEHNGISIIKLQYKTNYFSCINY